MPDTKETFPRGPSNEQTLLTELGAVKREAEGLYAQVLSSQAAYGRMKDERDALAVTAERQSEQIRRLRDWLALALANTYDMGMTTEDRRKLAEAEVFLKETAP